MALAEIDVRRSREELMAEEAKTKAVIAARVGNLEVTTGARKTAPFPDMLAAQPVEFSFTPRHARCST